MTRRAPMPKSRSRGSDKTRWATETETTGRKKRKTPASVVVTDFKALIQKR
jgi:hypothetical protein